MKYVLDTNALSFLMKGDVSVAGRLTKTPRKDVCVPQPVISEIEYGIARLATSKRKQMLMDRFKLFKAELKRMPWTDKVSHCFGKIKASLERRGEPIEDFDIAIAAHAMASDAVLVTADTSHMDRIQDLNVEDWSKDERVS
ncbi:MAG: type II toxin-antitoxin system VapC family toxin [Myxococcota bacterium]|nr:type II toxin-antitoxin system VapC family toxin [Myxococcota bacterium]